MSLRIKSSFKIEHSFSTYFSKTRVKKLSVLAPIRSTQFVFTALRVADSLIWFDAFVPTEPFSAWPFAWPFVFTLPPFLMESSCEVEPFRLFEYLLLIKNILPVMLNRATVLSIRSNISAIIEHVRWCLRCYQLGLEIFFVHEWRLSNKYCSSMLRIMVYVCMFLDFFKWMCGECRRRSDWFFFRQNKRINSLKNWNLFESRSQDSTSANISSTRVHIRAKALRSVCTRVGEEYYGNN